MAPETGDPWPEDYDEHDLRQMWAAFAEYRHEKYGDHRAHFAHLMPIYVNPDVWWRVSSDMMEALLKRQRDEADAERSAHRRRRRPAASPPDTD